MNNRMLAILTGLVILGMIILLGINMTHILTGEPINQTFVKYNDVRGMAVEHDKKLYTLNFEQQNAVINLLNRSVPVDEIKKDALEPDPKGIQKLIIYRFDNKPDTVLTPVAYDNQDFIFFVPEWVPNGYLLDLSEGELKNLLTETFQE